MFNAPIVDGARNGIEYAAFFAFVLLEIIIKFLRRK